MLELTFHLKYFQFDNNSEKDFKMVSINFCSSIQYNHTLLNTF